MFSLAGICKDQRALTGNWDKSLLITCQTEQALERFPSLHHSCIRKLKLERLPGSLCSLPNSNRTPTCRCV
uniref:Uncharacterized protein n=1 Tax=Aegilops tauschii subsp. strangulata TaxID=200361 RepID=A0A453S3H5_AEGTS